MSVQVVPEGQEPLEADEPVAASGPQSPLALLRGKRDALRRTLHVDLAVPRWDELLEGRRLWVRYGPASPNLFTDAMTRRQARHDELRKKGLKGDPDWMAKANADVLVDSCIAVYDLPADERPPEGDLPDGDFPTFASPELADSLSTEEQPVSRNACACAMALYGTSADVLLATTQLMNWSGEASKEANEDFSQGSVASPS